MRILTALAISACLLWGCGTSEDRKAADARSGGGRKTPGQTRAARKKPSRPPAAKPSAAKKPAPETEARLGPMARWLIVDRDGTVTFTGKVMKTEEEIKAALSEESERIVKQHGVAIRQPDGSFRYVAADAAPPVPPTVHATWPFGKSRSQIVLSPMRILIRAHRQAEWSTVQRVMNACIENRPRPIFRITFEVPIDLDLDAGEPVMVDLPTDPGDALNVPEGSPPPRSSKVFNLFLIYTAGERSGAGGGAKVLKVRVDEREVGTGEAGLSALERELTRRKEKKPVEIFVTGNCPYEYVRRAVVLCRRRGFKEFRFVLPGVSVDAFEVGRGFREVRVRIPLRKADQ